MDQMDKSFLVFRIGYFGRKVMLAVTMLFLCTFFHGRDNGHPIGATVTSTIKPDTLIPSS